MSKAKIIIYHNIKPGFSCPDGLAAAWAARKKHPTAELIGWEYQREDLPTVQGGDSLIIVDFSFSKAILEKWAESGCQVTVIDHHKTSEKFLQGFTAGILKFDMSKCGAVLTWEHFFPDHSIPTFLLYVQDQDLWQWKLPGSEAVREAFASLGRSFELFDRLENMSQEEFLDFMLPIGKPLLEKKKAKVEEIAKRHKWTKLRGHTIPVVKLKGEEEQRLRSDVCAWLYKNIPAPFSATYREEDETRTWDLRSDKNGNNFDVSAIAESFGGGGHRNASGFRQSMDESIETYDNSKF